MLTEDVRRGDPFAAEDDLLGEASRRLAALLGRGWVVEDVPIRADEADALWRVRPPRGGPVATVVVEAKADGISPRSVERVARQVERGRAQAGVPEAIGLLVAPYLGPRVRQTLGEHGLAHLDLTGNVSLRIDTPLVVVETDGAQQDPAPRPRGRRGMSGARAGRLVRDLVDRCPPQRGKDLAESTGLSEGYVSRLLEVFAEEAFVRRVHRVVDDVDWPGLLRARASTFELMKVNHVVPAVARHGLDDVLSRLRAAGHEQQVVDVPGSASPILATGTFAANGFAPLVVGGPVYLYIPAMPRAADVVCRQLGLMRVEQQAAADVLLLQPSNDGVFVRPHHELVDGVRIAGLSQVALDCLAGPGRLPAAGEELVSWMARHERSWRGPSTLAGSAD